MPGMMDTILNLGLNDESVEALAKLSNNPRFAYDSYRRLIQMFGNVVLDIEKHEFDEVFDGKFGFGHAGGAGNIDGGAGLGERLGDALPQDVAGAGIEVVDGTHAARGLLALLRGGLGVENVEVAVRLDGPGRDLAERLVPRDGWREPRGGEQEGRDHRDRREARQREQSAKARAPEQALPEGRFGVGGHSAAGSLPPAAAVPPISLESPVGPTGRRFFQPGLNPDMGNLRLGPRPLESNAMPVRRRR